MKNGTPNRYTQNVFLLCGIITMGIGRSSIGAPCTVHTPIVHH